jgi:DNA modification methylase
VSNYTKSEFLDGKVTLYGGDNRDVLRDLPDNSVDSICTDPPYALVSIVKRFGGAKAKPANDNDVYARASRGFMGKQWDTGEVAFSEVFWAECLRVLKPGGHVAAFSGTRTYHRMACAIEDAGFEIRDQLAWCYGSGFPKSHDVSKAIDKAAGAERTEVISHRKGVTKTFNIGATETVKGRDPITAPATPQPAEWKGWGTALKPAWEPICLGRKPLIGTVADNVLEHGTGAVNVDGCRVGDDVVGWGGGAAGGNTWGDENCGLAKAGNARPVVGRWPANIVHDGSNEAEQAFPDGSARFFYTAKADKQDRMGSKHPTVKPVDLMQWLCRLITPPGGTVLDPFAGSGSTGEAAWREGFKAILCEREEEYQADIAERLRLANAGPMERTRRAIKQVDSLGQLFGDNDNNPIGGGGQTDIRKVRGSIAGLSGQSDSSGEAVA